MKEINDKWHQWWQFDESISNRLTISELSVPLIPAFYLKGAVHDSGESLLIFELKSQTNTPLLSVLLQKWKLKHSRTKINHLSSRNRATSASIFMPFNSRRSLHRWKVSPMLTSTSDFNLPLQSLSWTVHITCQLFAVRILSIAPL